MVHASPVQCSGSGRARVRLRRMVIRIEDASADSSVIRGKTLQADVGARQTTLSW